VIPLANPALKVAPSLAMPLLEELIYERVRRHLDMLELGWFEADLDAAIQRVSAQLEAEAEADAAPASVVAAALIDRAWKRVEEEWRDHRGTIKDDCYVCGLDRRAREEILTETRARYGEKLR
jgi:hypothetical protein